VFTSTAVDETLEYLRTHGSQAIPFMNPEGIIVYHHASKVYFKKTLVADESPKGKVME
jgi:hypothetical protein